MKKSGFYIIKEQFFEDMNEPYLKGNKKENRPHYYCFEDENTGIYWMIPLSSKIEKYRKIMEKREAKGKACKALSQTDIPVLIIHGNEDTKAPLSMAYKLYDSCRSEKEIYIVNGADHAENYQADPEKYGDIIIRFIKKHMSYSQKED